MSERSGWARPDQGDDGASEYPPLPPPEAPGPGNETAITPLAPGPAPMTPPPAGGGVTRTPQQWGQPDGFFRAPKPGIVPLRPLAVGEIIDGAFASMRQNPGATFGLSAIAMTVTGLVSFLLGLAERSADTGAAALFGVVGLIITYTAQTALAGLLCVVVSEAVLGTKISLTAAFERVRPRLLGLLLLSLVVFLLIVLGAIGLLVGAFYVAVLLSLAGPAYVLEGGSIRDALRRSRELIKGAWWRTFGITLLIGLIATVCRFIILIPFLAVAAGTGDTLLGGNESGITIGTLVLSTLATIVGSTITTPISAGGLALIYVDRRIRAEGLDVTLARAAQDRAAQDQALQALQDPSGS